MPPERDLLQIQRNIQAESERIENVFHANVKKRTGVAMLISDKIDFETKTETLPAAVWI